MFVECLFLASTMASQQPPEDATAAKRPTVVEKNLGDRIGPFALRDLGGKTWTAEDWHDKTVIAVVWVTKCAWCQKALPAIQELDTALRGDERLGVVTFNLDTDEVDLSAFMRTHGYTFSVLRAGKFLQQTATPTVFIINRKGVICDDVKGYGSGWANLITARARAVDSQLGQWDAPAWRTTEH